MSDADRYAWGCGFADETTPLRRVADLVIESAGPAIPLRVAAAKVVNALEHARLERWFLYEQTAYASALQLEEGTDVSGVKSAAVVFVPGCAPPGAPCWCRGAPMRLLDSKFCVRALRGDSPWATFDPLPDSHTGVAGLLNCLRYTWATITRPDDLRVDDQVPIDDQVANRVGILAADAARLFAPAAAGEHAPAGPGPDPFEAVTKRKRGERALRISDAEVLEQLRSLERDRDPAPIKNLAEKHGVVRDTIERARDRAVAAEREPVALSQVQWVTKPGTQIKKTKRP